MLTVSTLAMMISVFALYILAPIGFTIFAKGKNANKINKVASIIGIVSFILSPSYQYILNKIIYLECMNNHIYKAIKQD